MSQRPRIFLCLEHFSKGKKKEERANHQRRGNPRRRRIARCAVHAKGVRRSRALKFGSGDFFFQLEKKYFKFFFFFHRKLSFETKHFRENIQIFGVIYRAAARGASLTEDFARRFTSWWTQVRRNRRWIAADRIQFPRGYRAEISVLGGRFPIFMGRVCGSKVDLLRRLDHVLVL